MYFFLLIKYTKFLCPEILSDNYRQNKSTQTILIASFNQRNDKLIEEIVFKVVKFNKAN